MRRASIDLTDPSRNIEESVGAPDPTTIDPEMDISLPSDEEDRRPYTPPPHIAARFYRPSQIRRKDSAASSRRNSISSVHSRSSHGFGRHGDVQSKYIAQQLRRASILEDRKARLADRAAHAEKVRLRAAMAKAAHQKNSNSEERALAAAQAREKNLAEIVAACAEEVKRAKAVAETMKEKREQELRKLKVQMEERLAEAERRREELRSKHAVKRSRGSSLTTKKPDVEVLPEVKEQESPVMSEDVAANKLQWWWRAAMRKKAGRDFAELGLSIDGVRDTSFEKVVDLLAQEKVLTITARVLRICGLKEGDAGSVNEMAAVRTFLSAFLILGHPTQVLSNKDNKGEQEQVGSLLGQPIPRDDLANPQLQDLVGKARDLLISFENILSRLTSSNNYTPPPAFHEALPESYATFHNAFIAWKARDSNALIEVMILQFVELDAILQTVKDRTEEAVTESYRQSIRDNQLMLMVRIKKLAGAQQGKKLIIDAVKEARKARAAKKPTGDTKPRVADHSLSGEGSTNNDDATADKVVSEQLQTLTPPPTPPSSTQEKRSVPQPSYPPILPDNRIIVHELAINREYRIEYQHFQEQHKLRMDPLFKDLKSGGRDEEKEFRYLIVMANYIKERLQHLVKPSSSLYTFIGEILDTEVAQRQFVAGSFSYDKFFSSMGSLLPKLCAPVRDDEVQDLVENKLSQGHIVDRLEALISFIDVMLYDYANYMLQVAAPNLIENASSYETKRFAEELEAGSMTLEHAEVSWRTARAKVFAEAARRDPEGINLPRSRPTADKIYWQMLLDEFTQPSPSANTIPEPLALDTKRRARLGLLTLRIATAGAILLQCKNILKRDVRAPWKTEAGRLFTVLEAVDDVNKPLEQSSAIDGIMAALEAGRSMPAASKAHLRNLVTKVLSASVDAKRENTEPREPVLRLLLTRLRGHILARFQTGSASEKVKATSVAGEKLASLGLPEFVERVREMVDEITRVGAIDRVAHGMWWETIAEKADKEEAATSRGN
ncbi:T-complex protein 11-domain-containing protein [Pseudomassariella vexata]|uniref:T-complex protein 11-domain-containing protein n=1 Tax=Pseudomassariella vexata TaxID=1141098 RepID=A0A1Y2DY32_9PEZI|nr:T-complex protein 11-domain-containing protein [Pseudomassariella vexata]ORY64147.1 T-complex protein 11-domain-containing protein [Pseudomassariella vexata]